MITQPLNVRKFERTPARLREMEEKVLTLQTREAERLGLSLEDYLTYIRLKEEYANSQCLVKNIPTEEHRERYKKARREVNLFCALKGI